MKMESPSSDLYADVNTDDALDTRCAMVYLPSTDMSSYKVFSRSTTGLTRLRYS